MSDADVWVPDYETTLVEVHGQEWPMVLVKKYEVNGIGERRFVESRFFIAAALGDDHE